MSAYVQTVVGSDSPPVGAVMDFAGNVEPSGWLFCFGQALPRTGIYTQLFGVIGTLYGAPDGSSFSLPDFRGRVGAGKDDMGGTAANRLTTAWGVNGAALGANGGGESHLLTTPQMPSHNHLSTWVVAGSGLAGGSTYTSGTPANPTSSTGGGLAHPNVQPTFIVNKIIKYSTSGVVLPIVPGEGDVVGPNGGVADGDVVVYNGTSGKIIKGGGVRFARGHLKGMQIANNVTDATNDIDISEGECRDSTNSVDIKLLGITKRLDAAWAVGGGQGGLDTGAIANTTYHVYAIFGSAVAVDVLFSASVGAPTLPAGYTHFRRIASILRVSAAIKLFLQTEDQFLTGLVFDYNSTAARSLSLLAVSVPAGLIVRPIFRALIVAATNNPSTMYYAPGNNSGLLITGPQTNTTSNADTTMVDQLTTNISAQIYLQVTVAGTIGAAYMQTFGWIDRRGQDD